jgi:hypothetical protein
MKFIIIAATLLVLAVSCRKQDNWLSIKSANADVTPSSLKDLQALLDNDQVMNNNYPEIGLVGADNYFVSYEKWESAFNAQERNAYIWASDIYSGEMGFDWFYAYQQIEYANVALGLLEHIKQETTNQLEWNNIKGSALFFRAYAFFNLAQLYARPYNAQTAASDMGIPLPLSSDVNNLSKRASVKETYDQIIKDLSQAKDILPITPQIKTRPSKVAAMGVLARTYLNMEDYKKAGSYADSALHLFNDLLDFNTLSPTPLFPLSPLQMNNKEIIFYSRSLDFSIIGYPARVDTLLYQSYDTNDLRRTILFKDRGLSGINFRGSYTGTYPYFFGVATNELFLIRAECFARDGEVESAMKDLNEVLVNRWKAGTFSEITAVDANDVLSKIIIERRKELPFTGNIRWEDLRRLNKDSRFSKTLTRVLNGTTYTLKPNDDRYTYPIPPDELLLNKLPQNQR